MEKSRATTVVPSQNGSVSDLEKEKLPAPPVSPFESGDLPRDRKEIETSGEAEAKGLEKLEDELEYPSGPKLALITLALCMSVFLVALVSMPCHNVRSYLLTVCKRTILSSQQPYPGSQITSKRLTMLGGMDQRTFSLAARSCSSSANSTRSGPSNGSILSQSSSSKLDPRSAVRPQHPMR